MCYGWNALHNFLENFAPICSLEESKLTLKLTSLQILGSQSWQILQKIT